MNKFLFLLLSILALASRPAHAQIRRGTGLLSPNYGPVLFYAYASRLTVQPQHREEFLRATRATRALVRREADCQAFYCYEDADAPNTFLLSGSWKTRPALRTHLAQPYQRAYFEQLTHWLAEPATLLFSETAKDQVSRLEAQP